MKTDPKEAVSSHFESPVAYIVFVGYFFKILIGTLKSRISTNMG